MPHCNEYIRVTIDVEARPLYRSGTSASSGTATTNGVPKAEEAQGLTEGQREALEVARSSGLLEAFDAVVRWVRAKEGGKSVPNDMEAFFLKFWAKVQPRQVPRPVLNLFIDAFPSKQIILWSADRIVAVCADGVIRCFIDQALVLGKRIEGTSVKVGSDEKTCAEWIRTRFGFVSGKGALLEEMRQKSLGGFARTIAP